MRIRRTLRAALLCSVLVFAPDQLRAGPIVSLIGGIMGSGGAFGGVFGGMWGFGAAGTLYTAGAAIGGSALFRSLLGLGLSSLVQEGSRPRVPAPAERMVNYAQPVAKMERGYGRVRKGGPFALQAPAIGARHYGVIIASHSTKGLVSHYLDKWAIEVDGAGNATTAPVAGYATLRAYNGHAGQAVDAIWLAGVSEVTAAHDFAGLSYVAARASKPAQSLHTTVYPTSREWVLNPVWDMDDQVYDPRDSTRKWTDNLALVIAREAERFGRAVHWDEVAEEATHCDSVVGNGDGGTQRKWTFNGVFDSGMSWETVRSQLMIAGDVFFYEHPDGAVGFKVGRYIAPTVTLTDADFYGLTVTKGQVGPDIKTEFAALYVEPARGYVETPSGAVVLAPGGRRDEVEAYGIDSHNQAARVAYRLGKASRAEFSFSGQLKPIGYELRGHRFARIVHTDLGLEFVAEIGKFGRLKGQHAFGIEGVSVEAADFEFDALTQEPARPIYVRVAEDGDIPAPASLSGEVVAGTGGVPLIEWTWPEQHAAYRQEIQMRRDLAGIGDWQIISAGEGQHALLAQGLVDGWGYEAQVRNRSTSGKVSDWAPELPISVTAVADTVPPAALVAFDAVVVSGNVDVTWTAPNSSNYDACRIWRATGSTDFGDAVTIRTEYGAANASDAHTDTAPGSGSHSYWAEPLNGSGKEGPLSGPVTITII